MAGVFTRWNIIGLLPMLAFECVKRYLQSQGIMNANMVIILIVAPVNVFLQYLLVWSPLSLGFIGSPIAMSLSNILMLVLSVFYIRYVDGGKVWGGWDLKAAFDFVLIYEFLKLGLPGVCMVVSEWAAYEICALIAGFFVASLNSTVLYTVRNNWGYVWNPDPEVAKVVASVLPLAAFFQLSDAIGAIGGGILRGCGRQSIGAWANLVAYYIIGIPFGIVAAFAWKFGLVGVWAGLTIALCLVSLIEIVVVFRLDWREESQKALVRVSEEQ
ncbi:hypothetical protein HK096_011596, partial [Nowakowskiella sp. JEL0078]